jgi:hypothetical protein
LHISMLEPIFSHSEADASHISAQSLHNKTRMITRQNLQNS